MLLKVSVLQIRQICRYVEGNIPFGEHQSINIDIFCAKRRCIDNEITQMTVLKAFGMPNKYAAFACDRPGYIWL